MKKKSIIGIVFITALLFLGISFQLKSMNVLGTWMQKIDLFNTKKPVNIVNTTAHGNTIQIALLLDTSNSMDGLIEQAKSQLWRLVSELSRAKRGNITPNLQIALYEYGNDNLSAGTGHIRQVTAFTSDMDVVSEKLFALTTNGGNEYCGHVIQTSLKELKWNKDDACLRMMYIAGNESFTQGSVPYREVCLAAKARDIVVNTIFCGDHQQGINTLWKDGAVLTNGEYSSIDHNKATVYIISPYDKKIEALNQKLNKTYIPYGKRGKKAQKNMEVQDSNASSYGQSNAVSRAEFKSSKMYSNDSWDLVDAYKKDKKIIEKEEELPDNLKGKSVAEIETEISEMVEERATIQDEIQALSKERRKYVDEQKELQGDDDVDLEKSILKSVKKKAKEKGYIIEN